MTVKEILKIFVEEKGLPDLIVASVVQKFPFRELLHGMDEIVFITLPEQVWERDKVFVQNWQSNLVFFADAYCNEVLENVPTHYSWTGLPPEIQQVLSELKKELAGIGWDIKDMVFERIKETKQ